MELTIEARKKCPACRSQESSAEKRILGCFLEHTESFEALHRSAKLMILFPSRFATSNVSVHYPPPEFDIQCIEQKLNDPVLHTDGMCVQTNLSCLNQLTQQFSVARVRARTHWGLSTLLILGAFLNHSKPIITYTH